MIPRMMGGGPVGGPVGGAADVDDADADEPSISPNI
jgi:hypothetical protein